MALLDEDVCRALLTVRRTTNVQAWKGYRTRLRAHEKRLARGRGPACYRGQKPMSPSALWWV